MNDLNPQENNPASLTASERASMKRDFMAFMEANPVPEKRAGFISPYFPHLIRVPAMIAAFLLVVGGTSYAAEKSLPTDLLYPFKTEVLEAVFIEAPARTPLAKAQASQKLVERRLEEAEVLVEQDEMDAEASSVIVAALSEHTNAVHAYVTEASLAGDLSEALDVGTDLENALEAHGEVLESISDEGEPAGETVEALIEEVADQADEAEGVSEGLEQQAIETVTNETNEYLSETAAAAEISIGELKAKVADLPTYPSQELVKTAVSLLKSSESAYALGTDYLSEGKEEAALPQLRDALQNAEQGIILIDSHIEYDN